MVNFYIKLTVAWIESGMDKEEAIMKVPKKYRDSVYEAIKEGL